MPTIVNKRGKCQGKSSSPSGAVLLEEVFHLLLFLGDKGPDFIEFQSLLIANRS